MQLTTSLVAQCVKRTFRLIVRSSTSCIYLRWTDMKWNFSSFIKKETLTKFKINLKIFIILFFMFIIFWFYENFIKPTLPTISFLLYFIKTNHFFFFWNITKYDLFMVRQRNKEFDCRYKEQHSHKETIPVHIDAM